MWLVEKAPKIPVLPSLGEEDHVELGTSGCGLKPSSRLVHGTVTRREEIQSGGPKHATQSVALGLVG